MPDRMDLGFAKDYDIEVDGRLYKIGDEISWSDDEEGDLSAFETLDSASVIAAEKPAPLDFHQALITASLYSLTPQVWQTTAGSELELCQTSGRDDN